MAHLHREYTANTTKRLVGSQRWWDAAIGSGGQPLSLREDRPGRDETHGIIIRIRWRRLGRSIPKEEMTRRLLCAARLATNA